jgi:geranylgeranyl diphosphate synthase type II
MCARASRLDMNFEQRNDVILAEYEEMIALKTAVLLASALKMGAIIGGADITQAKVPL